MAAIRFLVRAASMVAVLAVGAGCGDDPSAGPSSAATATAATTATGSDFEPGRQVASFDVGAAMRTAVLVVPADLSRPVPVVFAFHGHGGSGAGIERTLHIERLWPEAVVVYPDGLVGHKGITDPEGTKPGWQTVPGESEDRDVAFYDTMLASLRSNLPVDTQRLYVMGHSNGSAFTSLLLAQRGDAIAATANSSAAPGAALLATAPARSMFLSIGIRDAVVPYDRQKDSIPLAAAKLGADLSGATVDGHLRSAPGRGGLELATYVHPGGHEIPPEVPPLIVDFFRRHTRSGG